MKPINDKEEKDLDRIASSNRGGYSCIVSNPLGDIHYIASKENILLYGELDMNNTRDVLCLYEQHGFLINSSVNDGRNRMYTHVNYTTGEVEKVDGRFRRSETWDLETWIKYNLLLLGNPNKVIIFKNYKK